MRRVKRFCLKALTTLILVLLLFLLQQLLWMQYAEYYGTYIIWAEPRLADIYFYGEQAHFELRPGFGNDVQLIAASDKQLHNHGPASYINQGCDLASLPSGLYHVYAAGLSVLAPHDFERSGYTITRNGQNQHYRFYTHTDGRLLLSLETVTSLPEDVYDIMVDPGHGGADRGSIGWDWEEKVENLRAGLYMAELFQERGFKVALTRTGDYYPGQPGVTADEIDMYVENGQIHLVYQSNARYMISNHLNGSPTGLWRGYQLYTSVRADYGWAEEIAAVFEARGHTANDNLHGFGRYGLYKRLSGDEDAENRDYYYVLRETGGLLTEPVRMLDRFPELDFHYGTESILVEYLFIDNIEDRAYWHENWQMLVEAVVDGCCAYWGIE